MARLSTVIIVDDDALIRSFLKITCEALGTEVIGVAGNAATADALLGTSTPDYVLMDVRLGGNRDGVDIANAHSANLSRSKIIYVTGSGDKLTMDRINQDHPYKILIKPIAAADLRSAIS